MGGSRRSQGAHLGLSAVVGLIVALIFHGLFFIGVLPYWTMLYGYPFNVPALTTAPSADVVIAAQLSLAQVYYSFVAVWIGTALGYFAIIQFRQSQERPDLRLSFHTRDAVLHHRTEDTMDITVGNWTDAPHQEMYISVLNKGDGLTPWFQVQIMLPYAPLQCRLSLFNPVIGEDGRHWRQFIEDNGTPGVTFLSCGDFAAFVDVHLVIGSLIVGLGVATPGRYACPYSITYDGGPQVNGVLHVTIS